MFFSEKISQLEGTIVWDTQEYPINKKRAFSLFSDLYLKSKGAVVVDYSLSDYGVLKVFVNLFKNNNISIEEALAETANALKSI